MGVEQLKYYLSTPSLALPLQGGGNIKIYDFLLFRVTRS